jgi:glycosyltransferase 2 family protein
MLNAMNVVTRTVDRKITWSRIGFATSLLIIAVAAFTLLRLLRDVDVGKVVAALQATSRRQVLLAGIFVLTGYATLTLYDFFSLRTIGRHEVPYRIAALASFTSYSIGHTLGATVFTGGAVRLRIYSAWGLSIMEVAKIAFVTGLTFWLGNAFILSIGMAYSPEAAGAVSQLPPWINRVLALTGLAAIVGYVAWLFPRPRVIGRGQWQITLPNAYLTLAQIGIGVLDLSSGALAMYTLLPAQPPLDFITVLVTFVMATLLGFLSHAPGSLGVFEAALLVGLPQFEKEGLLGSLVIFRLLYFILPFTLALIILGIRELSLGARAATATQVGNNLDPPSP